MKDYKLPDISKIFLLIFFTLDYNPPYYASKTATDNIGTVSKPIKKYLQEQKIQHITSNP